MIYTCISSAGHEPYSERYRLTHDHLPAKDMRELSFGTPRKSQACERWA